MAGKSCGVGTADATSGEEGGWMGATLGADKEAANTNGIALPEKAKMERNTKRVVRARSEREGGLLLVTAVQLLGVA